jgi:tetratricopeptide (TPR) repeat protein
VRHAEATLQRFPDCFRGHHNLAVALFERGEHARSRDHALRACELLPENAESWDVLGLSASFLPGREEEAELALRRALDLEPALSLAHLHLAALLMRTSRDEEALPHLRTAWKLERVPENRDYVRTLLERLGERVDE